MGIRGRIPGVIIKYTLRWSLAMPENDLLKRITARPDIFGGKPVIRDMRVSVELILSLLAQNVTWDELLDDYPGLERDDIRACLAYAHAVIANESLDQVRITA